MKEATITLLGNEYKARFDIQTMTNYERIAKQPFFNADYAKVSDRLALVVAAICSADPKAEVDSDSILKKGDLDTFKEIVAAFSPVLDLMNDFFEIPDVEPEEKKPEPGSEGKVKN